MLLVSYNLQKLFLRSKKLDSYRHFLLKCLYQEGEMYGQVRYICVMRISCLSFYDLFYWK